MLVSQVAAANPRTIVVMYEGAQTLMPWIGQVAAAVMAWYPGQEGANALASILFGDVNPSGKLPVTVPVTADQVPCNTPSQYPGINLQVSYSEGLQMGYRWYDAQNVTPLFPFGYGLSYTTFGYNNLSVGQVSASGQLLVGFDLSNTGNRAGSEAAQLYLGFPGSAGEPPKLLRGFKKVNLGPGQTSHVTFNLGWEDLARWDQALSSGKLVGPELFWDIGTVQAKCGQIYLLHPPELEVFPAAAEAFRHQLSGRNTKTKRIRQQSGTSYAEIIEMGDCP